MLTSAPPLPLPTLTRVGDALTYLSDPALTRACGVTIAFTGRAGGISEAPFDRLNLSGQVGDEPIDVNRNRRLLRECLGIDAFPLVIPHQVHGTDFLVLDEGPDSLNPASIAPETIDCDAVVVDRAQVAAMLCFADCVPVIIVTPSGRFAVVHAGWRGVLHSIARLVVEYLADDEDPAQFNVYIGPHIGAECFECGSDTHEQFVQAFGDGCVFDERRIDLSAALAIDLTSVGVDGLRICDCGICTVCSSVDYFSYRAEDGYCGRQAALAWRAIDREGSLR